MTTVRLYGFTDGHGSYAQVLHGFEVAFQAYGYGQDRLAVVPLGERSDDEEPLPLPQADVGIFLGPPSAASAIRQHAEHRVRCVMVAPNSDKLPEETMRIVNAHATHVLAPSEWAAGVLMAYTPHPIIVVPHGVHAEFQPVSSPNLELKYEQGIFRVLHLSSTGRERKGTLELVQAWRILRKGRRLPAEARLWLVLVTEGRARVLDWLRETEETLEGLGIELGGRLGQVSEGASPTELRQVFGGVHVVCQPSRGEAFGMVPLEALACGVPIVATNCTGHSQWFGAGLDGAVPIPTSRHPSPIDDLPGARAPDVYVKDIALALEFAYSNWHKVKAAALVNAQGIRLGWSWERSLGAFRNWLEGETR